MSVSSGSTISVLDLLSRPVLHIFGYGSLIWKAGFEYDSVKLGYITGYERRFWQGSTHHRGTEEKPGRVLTAIPKENGRIYGITYTVTGRDKMKFALEALGVRETLLGGYSCMLMDFYSAEEQSSTLSDEVPCDASSQVLLYVALPDNPIYAGEMPEQDLGKLVSDAEGVCGPNSDYITKLADFMRSYFPLVKESHLYSVDFYVRKFDDEKRTLLSKSVVPSSAVSTSKVSGPSISNQNGPLATTSKRRSSYSENPSSNLLVEPITV